MAATVKQLLANGAFRNQPPISSSSVDRSELSQHHILLIQRSVDEMMESNYCIQKSVDEIRQYVHQRDEALRSFIQQQLEDFRVSMWSGQQRDSASSQPDEALRSFIQQQLEDFRVSASSQRDESLRSFIQQQLEDFRVSMSSGQQRDSTSSQRDESLRSFIQQQLEDFRVSISSGHQKDPASSHVVVDSDADCADGEVDEVDFFDEQSMQAQGPPKVIEEANKKLNLSTTTKDDVGLGHVMRATKGDQLQMLVQSLWFQITVVVVIILQALLLGWESHTYMGLEIDRLEGRIDGSKDSLRPGHFETVGWCFNVFFLLELLLRMMAWKLKFFDLSDEEFFAWNMFDSLVICGLILELVDVQTDVLRAARMLRVARVLRLVRMFAKLRKMIYALLHSMQSLLWLMILLTTTLYIFSLVFMQGARMYLQKLQPDTYDSGIMFGESHDTYIIVHRFGSVFLTMRSLFATITGGDPWDWLFAPIMGISWGYSIVALFFIMFFIFAVMNVVTGVFVDEAMKISQIDKDILITDKMEEEIATIQDIKQFVSGVDKNGDGHVSIEELTDMLENEQVQRWLMGLDIDIGDENLGQVCRILDPEQTGNIDPQMFFDILVKLKGEARSADLILLAHDIKLEQRLLRDILAADRRMFKKMFKRQNSGDWRR